MKNLLLFAALFAIIPIAANAQSISSDRVYPPFSIGPTGVIVTIEKGLKVTVQEIAPGSPAESAGLREGDILTAACGKNLAVPDPRVPLGEAIGKAEGSDGKVVFNLTRDGEAKEATVSLPILGSYAPTWPENCRKSAAIIRSTAEFIASSQQEDGSYVFDRKPGRDGLSACLAGIFLLSTGNDAYLPNVKLHATELAKRVAEHPTQSNWHLGYQGIFLAEYYLKTGDKSVLAGLKSLCDQAVGAQAAGAWGHGGIPGPGYTQSGLMNSAGIPVLTTLILARECGVEVDDAAYERAVRFFYRMAGHGCICYGDHRSELWWSNTNGRNAKTACALSLLDEPRFQKAAQHLALLVTDSYFQPEFGHTGGGFNVMWRGIASVHVPEDRREHYRRQMNILAWYYDLCRQPGGGFSMLPTPPDNSRYSGLNWGTGAVALTYTAPLKTLRITGAPRTKFSVPTEPLKFSWGTDSDLSFIGTDDPEGFGEETHPPHEVYELSLGKRKSEATEQFYAKHLHHYSPLVRSWAARELGRKKTPEAHAILKKASAHADPRVRRAAFDGVSGYDNWGRPIRPNVSTDIVSNEFLPAILKTLKNPESAWWEIDGALFALAAAKPEDIRANFPLIVEYSKHPEWYIREAAFWAIVGLHSSINEEEFGELLRIYADSIHVFARSSYDAGFRQIVRSDKAALDRLSMKEAARVFGNATHQPIVALGYGDGGIHEAAHRTMMILKHFDASIYEMMIADFVEYLKIWEPYYQHSGWLISGSKWQPGILNVLDGLGEKGKPIVTELKAILAKYDTFDPKRNAREAQGLKEQIEQAVKKWESAHGG